ncbi:MAG: hypothetical protein HFH11_11235 [Dorea sp.]|jgi:hypothetical protein|nr:hypothetical protein [Dorea sp.]
MTDLQDKTHCPSFDELCEYIRSPAFGKFSQKVRADCRCTEKTEFSNKRRTDYEK